MVILLREEGGGGSGVTRGQHEMYLLYQVFSFGPPTSSQMMTWGLTISYECSSFA